MLLKSPVERQAALDARQQVMVLSALSEAHLEKSLKALAEHLDEYSDEGLPFLPNLADIAYTLQTGRKI